MTDINPYDIDLLIPADGDADDCLHAAERIAIAVCPALADYRLLPRWTDGDRETVTITVPLAESAVAQLAGIAEPATDLVAVNDGAELTLYEGIEVDADELHAMDGDEYGRWCGTVEAQRIACSADRESDRDLITALTDAFPQIDFIRL